MDVFYCGNPEELLLLIRYFQMNIEPSGTFADDVNIKYICTLVRGEALHQLYTLSVEVGSTITEDLNRIILCLGT